jgi:hypothetical protein
MQLSEPVFRDLTGLWQAQIDEIQAVERSALAWVDSRSSGPDFAASHEVRALVAEAVAVKLALARQALSRAEDDLQIHQESNAGQED